MILEGLVTTLNDDRTPHLAPMGPRVDPDLRRFVLRPFPSSHTYRNLRRRGEGVLHVTDDALLVARAAIGAVDPFPNCRPAERIDGVVLMDACRFYEFRVIAADEREERVRLDCETLHSGTIREFFGFNRARHAIIEAAVLATRTAFLPLEPIAADFRRFAEIVGKTGGPAEQEAMALLQAHLDRALAGRTT